MDEIQDHFHRNLQRVQNLLALYDTTVPKAKGRKPVMSADLLRSAIVFLHSALEDLLRSVELRKIPSAGEAVLNDIPLVGLRGGEKFPLGKLAAHRGKTVDKLISESVDAYLERQSYNNPDDLAAFCGRTGIEKKNFQPYFAELGEFMKHRHHIVHRADRDEKSGSGHHHANSISKARVNMWLEAVRNFGAALLNEVLPPLAV